MTTVCVIGSNSFSGSDFIDLLLEERDYDVIGMSRSPEDDELFLPYKQHAQAGERFTFHRMDLNKDMRFVREIMDDVQPEYVVNFAAQSEVAPSWEHPEQWFQTNGAAVAELTNYLRKQEWLERYVHISSPEVYGSCEGDVTEDEPPDPSTPYAASKAAGDMMISTLIQNFDFPAVTIRATNVYGAHQQLHKIIPRSVIYLNTRRTIELHGGGEAVKSYIHIRDVSRGELAAMENGRNGEIYHLSPDKGISIRELVRKICNLMGEDFAERTEDVGERLGQDKAYVIDSTKTSEEFDWTNKIELTEGLEAVVSWIEHNFEKIKKQPIEYKHKE